MRQASEARAAAPYESQCAGGRRSGRVAAGSGRRSVQQFAAGHTSTARIGAVVSNQESGCTLLAYACCRRARWAASAARHAGCVAAARMRRRALLTLYSEIQQQLREVTGALQLGASDTGPRRGIGCRSCDSARTAQVRWDHLQLRGGVAAGPGRIAPRKEVVGDGETSPEQNKGPGRLRHRLDRCCRDRRGAHVGPPSLAG